MANKRTQTYRVTPVITATPYTANDALGAVFQLSEAARSGGIVNCVTVVDLAGQKKLVDLILFDAEPATPTADNAAFALAAGDVGKVVGTLQVADTDYIDLGSDAMATVSARAINFSPTPSGALWGQLIIRAAGTYAAGDLRVVIGIIAD